MSIKGCSRQMIVLNGTGSSIFETAYFIVKSDLQRQSSHSDMLREANRIVEENCFSDVGRGDIGKFGRRKRAFTRGLIFGAGALCGGSLIGIIWVLTLVFGG